MTGVWHVWLVQLLFPSWLRSHVQSRPPCYGTYMPMVGHIRLHPAGLWARVVHNAVHLLVRHCVRKPLQLVAAVNAISLDGHPQRWLVLPGGAVEHDGVAAGLKACRGMANRLGVAVAGFARRQTSLLHSVAGAANLCKAAIQENVIDAVCKLSQAPRRHVCRTAK